MRFLIIAANNCWVDLTGISAKKLPRGQHTSWQFGWRLNLINAKRPWFWTGKRNTSTMKLDLTTEHGYGTTFQFQAIQQLGSPKNYLTSSYGYSINRIKVNPKNTWFDFENKRALIIWKLGNETAALYICLDSRDTGEEHCFCFSSYIYRCTQP